MYSMKWGISKKSLECVQKFSVLSGQASQTRKIMDTEKNIIEIPAKALDLEHASCPDGHKLMDSSVPINGYPSIKVVLQYDEIQLLM